MKRKARKTIRKVAYATLGTIIGAGTTVVNGIITPIMIPVNAVKGARLGVKMANRKHHMEEPERTPEEIIVEEINEEEG